MQGHVHIRVSVEHLLNVGRGVGSSAHLVGHGPLQALDHWVLVLALATGCLLLALCMSLHCTAMGRAWAGPGCRKMTTYSNIIVHEHTHLPAYVWLIMQLSLQGCNTCPCTWCETLAVFHLRKWSHIAHWQTSPAGCCFWSWEQALQHSSSTCLQLS